MGEVANMKYCMFYYDQEIHFNISIQNGGHFGMETNFKYNEVMFHCLGILLNISNQISTILKWCQSFK